MDETEGDGTADNLRVTLSVPPLWSLKPGTISGGTWALGRSVGRAGLCWDSGGETEVRGFLEKSPKRTSVAGDGRWGESDQMS